MTTKAKDTFFFVHIFRDFLFSSSLPFFDFAVQILGKVTY
jgi:hypothetical protein